MIFTIGRKLSYDAALEAYAANPNKAEKPMKMGRTDEYEGGSVWRTPEAARKHCPPGFVVYGLKARWGKDTMKADDGPWHYLLVDAEFVALPERFRPKSKRRR